MPHDARLLVLVLFVVSLKSNHVAANSARSHGPYHEHPRRLLHHIGVPSLNSSSEVTGTGSKQAAASAQGGDRIAHRGNLKVPPRVPMFVSGPLPAIKTDSPDPDLVSYTFSGVVAVNVTILAPTRFLVLNVEELIVDPASINFKVYNGPPTCKEKCLVPTEVVFFKDDQIMVIGFQKELPVGEGVLRMHFNGTLNDEMRGFFKSKFQYKGKIANMAATNFEPVDARRCFPCWDEPSFKAKFKISLEVPSELVALSNMHVSSEVVVGPMKITHFEESPLMSTYLVAMVVGIFDFVEHVTSQGTRVRVYTEVGKSEQGKFALDVGVKSLDFYNDYFGTPYALSKLDMIAINNFNWMGMENYGLITFNSQDFLFDETSSTSTKQQEIAGTVAHELAHQWCGNLVTMEWWNHLWLSEGLSTWMGYQAVDSIFPQWNILMEFLDSTISTLKLDSIVGSHSIEDQIHHSNEIIEIFDDINYIKGASILRMLHSYLGAEHFQKALASYIKKYAYSNAKTEDLWAVFEEKTGEPLKDFMISWTKQRGYPIIDVKHKGKGIQLEQAQFELDGSSQVGSWVVPITLRCDSSTKKFFLKHKYDKFDLCGKPVKDVHFLVKLNINETGFYRVKYDKEIAVTLQKALETDEFSSSEKIGIMENSLALSMSLKDTMESLLHIVYACREEADYNVLTHIHGITTTAAEISIDAMPNWVGDSKQLLIKILLSPTLKLGWDAKDGEGDLVASLRQSLLVALVKLGHENTINEGLRRFDILIHDHNSSILSTLTKKAAYLSVIQNVTSSNRSGYDALRQVYKDSIDVEEKRRVLGVLSSCLDKDIVLESLNLILIDEDLNQYADDVLKGITIYGRETAWSWLKENWDRILKVLPEKDLRWSIVNNIVPLFTSNDKAEEISKFFRNYMDRELQKALKANLEMVRINMRWIEGIQSEPRLAETVHELLHKP